MVSVPEHLYPFDSQHLELEGGRMHYLDEGEGPPVVMVHGNPSWSFYFRDLIVALRQNHRCIAPDHIGCGLSDKPSDDRYRYTLERRVADLGALLDAVEPKRPITLVLHDWGGAIGMGWAVRNPERVARIVLLNTGAFRNPKDKGLPFSVWLARNTLVGAWLVQGLNAFSLGAATLGVVTRMPSEVRRAYTAPYNSWANRIATLRFVQDIPLGPEDPAWSCVLETEEGLTQFDKTPVLVCWGRKDFVFDDAFLAEWKRRWPQSEVHSFEDGGHYVLEDKTEDIVGLVRAFLRRAPVEAQPA